MSIHKTAEGFPAKESDWHFEARRQAVLQLEEKIGKVMRIFGWICIAVSAATVAGALWSYGLPDSLMGVIPYLIIPGIFLVSYLICRFAFSRVIRASWKEAAHKYEYVKAVVTKKCLKFFTKDAEDASEEIALEDILKVSYDSAGNVLRIEYNSEYQKDGTPFMAAAEIEDTFCPPLREVLME